MDAGYILGKLTPFANNKYLLSNDQTTDDIIKQIIDTHKKYKSDYDKISNYFWKGSVKKTCKYLFNFLKDNVQYSIEPDTRQSVKSPAAILSTGKYKHGGNDCKHYSLFQAGILDSLNRKGKKIEWCYRFANYKLFQTTPHHVFIVVTINGKEFWCDPVLNYWDQKKMYLNKIDKKMSLYSISGTNCNPKRMMMVRDSFGQLDVIGKHKTRAERKAKRSTRRAGRREGENCKGRTVAKYAPPLIAGRKAFLLLVRLNFKKFALKLYKSLQDPAKRDKLFITWCKLGGNARMLEGTVNKAVNKYKRKHPGTMIGAVALTAVITAATPIIVALLKFMGGNSADIENAPMDQAEDQSTMPAEESTQDAVGSIDPYMLYGAIGLGALYLLTRKKSR